MLNLIKSFIISAMLFVFTISSAANSPQNIQNNRVQVNAINIFENSVFNFKNFEANTFWANSNANENTVNYDESSWLSGVWRMQYKGNICYTQTELIFQNNGGYSGYTQCSDGSYAFHTVGRWYILRSGAVRVQYTDYNPKRDQAGNPIRIPDGETMNYQIVDQNRMRMGGIIAYRAQ